MNRCGLCGKWDTTTHACDGTRSPVVTAGEMALTIEELRVVRANRAWLDEGAPIGVELTAKTLAIIDRLTADLARVTADRDEWREQHENALASWRTDVATLLAQRDKLEAAVVAVWEVGRG